MVSRQPRKCRYGVPSHTIPLPALEHWNIVKCMVLYVVLGDCLYTKIVCVVLLLFNRHAKLVLTTRSRSQCRQLRTLLDSGSVYRRVPVHCLMLQLDCHYSPVRFVSFMSVYWHYFSLSIVINFINLSFVVIIIILLYHICLSGIFFPESLLIEASMTKTFSQMTYSAQSALPVKLSTIYCLDIFSVLLGFCFATVWLCSFIDSHVHSFGLSKPSQILSQESHPSL